MSQPHILYRIPTGKRRRDKDSGMVTSIVSLASEETNIKVASGLVKSVALPETTVDLYIAVIEAATVESIVVLLPDGQGDEHDYPADAGIVTSVGSVSLSVAAVTYVAENTVITSISQISSSDTHGSVVGTNYIDAGTLTAVASISATVIHTTPNDAATITAVSVPTAAEVTTYVSESTIVTGTAHLVPVEQTIFIDPAPNLTNIVTTVASILAGVETVAWNPDADIIISLGVPVSAPTDAAAYIDNTQYLTTSVNLKTKTSLTLTRPTTGTTVASGTEGSTDAGTATGIAIVTATEIGPIRVSVPVATASARSPSPSVVPPINPPAAIASTPTLLPSNTLLPLSGLVLLSGIPIPTIQMRIGVPIATATASVLAVIPGISLFPPVSTAVTAGAASLVSPSAATAAATAPVPTVSAGYSIRNQAGFTDSSTANNVTALNSAITTAAANLNAGADTYIDQDGISQTLTGNPQGLVLIPYIIGAGNTNIYSFADGTIVPKSNVRIQIDSGVEIRQFATTPGTGPMFQCDQGATTVTNFTICVGDKSRTAPAYQSGTTTGGRATTAERTGKWMMNLDAGVYGCSPDVKGVRFGGLAHHCRVGDMYAQAFCSETGGNANDGTSGMIINAPNPTRGNANNIVLTDCIGETTPSYGITEWNAGDNCIFLRLGCYGGVAVRWETQASTYSLTPVVPLSLSHNRAYDCWGKDSRRPLVFTNHSTRFTVDDNIAYRTTSYSAGMLANCGNTPNDGGTPTITNCEIHDSTCIAGHTALNTTGNATWARGDSTDFYNTIFGAQPVIVNSCYNNTAGIGGFNANGVPACILLRPPLSFSPPLSLPLLPPPSSLIPAIQLTVPPAAMTASASSIAPSATGSFTLANTFEGGSNGTTITTGNSGGTSGNAFDSTSGTVPIFSTTHAMHGTLGLAMQGAGNVRWSSTSVTGSNTTLYGRTYVYITAAPNVQAILVGGQTPTSTTLGQFVIRINTNRKVGLIAKSSTAVVSTTSLTTATWYRLEFKMVTVASGTCTLDCNIYVGDSTTLTEAMTQATGTGGVNDTSINGFLWGSVNTVTANVVFLDDMQVNASGFPGHS